MKLLPFQKPIGTDSEKFSYYAKQVYLGYVYDFGSQQSGLGEALWSYKDAANQWHYYYEVPAMTQYFRWLGNIFTRWDWGTSIAISPNLSAITIIGQRLPVSMTLNIISTIFAVPLGIILGIVAALNKNKTTDHVISTIVMILISIPSFILITFLLYFLCYKTGWLPSKWPSPTAPLGRKIAAYIIPVLSLSLGSIARLLPVHPSRTLRSDGERLSPSGADQRTDETAGDSASCPEKRDGADRSVDSG